ncbi:MAG: CPBP family intramembrane glutamic endopeptidase [Chitinophagales bacterium]
MNRRQYFMDNIHPAGQIGLLGWICIISAMMFYFLSKYLMLPLFHISSVQELSQAAISNPQGMLMNANQVNALKFLQFMLTMGTFLFPALLFAKLKFPEGDFLKLNSKISLVPVMLGILILISATPFVDLMFYLNQQLKLPSFLYGIEKLIRDSENADEQFTLLFLKTPRPADLWINLIVIAIIPAIAEELLFRGCLQQILRDWTKNIHVAVWGAAILFSFIHFQFYGFVPRVLLGALLGYLFVWSGSLWVPIIAHAINNGAQVILAYLHEHEMIQLDITSDQMLPVSVTLIASVICIGLLWLYRRIVAERQFIY